MENRFDIALSFAMEDYELVNTVYHYLKSEGLRVFFAPSPLGQSLLSGQNQREVFCRIFGLNTTYVALFVSKNYISKAVPMEEARIAIAKHSDTATVIPIYLDDAVLPPELLDPKQVNYFKSSNPAQISNLLASRVNPQSGHAPSPHGDSSMHISGNSGEKQVFIQTLHGDINL